MRRTAVESLGKIGDPETTRPMLPLLQDPTAIVREASVRALGRVKPTATAEMVELLTQALEDPAESVQQAAAVAIGEIEPGRAQTHLGDSAVVRVVSDPLVSSGGCLLQSDFGLIDAGIDAQLAEMASALGVSLPAPVHRRSREAA